MKKIFEIAALALAGVLLLSSCQKNDWLGGADTTTLSMSYDLDGNTLPVIPAAGKTFTKAVVINQGSVNRDIDWTVTVDNEPSWVSVSKTTVETEFTGTYGGDDRTVQHKAVEIKVDPNDSGAKRSCVIRFTVADGSSISTVLTQSK